MRVATWNVNGIRARQAQVQAWIEAAQPDIICLQEIKATAAQVPSELREMVERDYWSYWHGGPGGYSGVSLHVRKDLAAECPTFSHPDFDFENRMVVARLGKLHVASIYVPNGGKDFPAKLSFLEALRGYMEALHQAGAQLIFCGDINIARAEIDVHPTQRRPVIGQLPEERTLFERLLATGIVDIGRTLAPEDDRLFTWWAPWRNLRARNIGWRLDYILASEGTAGTSVACSVAREIGTSDHAPVVADFRIASAAFQLEQIPFG